MSDTKEWAQAFIAAAEEGHAGKTMQIVSALTIRSVEDDVPPAVAEIVDLDSLVCRLAGESSVVRRVQMVRDWLATYRTYVIQHWVTLALPLPPVPHSADSSDPEPEPVPVALSAPLSTRGCSGVDGGSALGSTGDSLGLVVFDFDLTLAAKNVGIFDLEDCVNRSFGGAKRVLMLQNMLQRLSDSNVQIVVLTFNSSHTVRKALGPHPGCGLLSLIRGCKTNVETIIGCEDYTDKERSTSKGRQEMGVKSAVINERWLRPGCFQASQMLFVVSKAKPTPVDPLPLSLFLVPFMLLRLALQLLATKG